MSYLMKCGAGKNSHLLGSQIKPSLTFQDIVNVGVAGIVIDLVIVTVTILGGIWIGRLLKMDKDTALLTSVGSGICGAAAVLGAESTIRTQPYKTAVAVATVVIFGTISMFLYPIAYNSGWLDLTPQEMGIFTGSTLHEVHCHCKKESIKIIYSVYKYSRKQIQ